MSLFDDVIVNAEISSASGDYGYVTVTEGMNAPSYSNSTGRFIYIYGEQKAQNYSTTLEGGKLYYLHLGYYKNSSISSGEDKFTINSVEVVPNGDYLYHVDVETNSKGQAITQIPFGKYKITEITAPDGYILNEAPTVVEFRSTEGAQHEFTIENEKTAKVTVHHYIKGTTTSLADDEYLEGKQGEDYITLPRLNLLEYELEIDENGEYILPENSTETYTHEEQVVTYYYVKKQVPLTVHHYIEGTASGVRLADGSYSKGVTSMGNEGEEYTTEALTEEELDEKFELVRIPSNASGTYEYQEVEVNYYYNEKEFDIVTRVEEHEEIDSLGTVSVVKGGSISGEGETPYETVEYKEDSTKEIKAVPDEGYEIKSIKVNGIEIEFTAENDGSVVLNNFVEVTEDKEVVVEFQRKQGTLIVHHYVEDTTDSVPLKDGTLAEDEIRTGNVGDGYATKVLEDASEGYDFVSVLGDISGEYIDGTIEVTYYYRAIPTSVLVHHYIDGTTTSLSPDVTIEGLHGDRYTTDVAEVESKYVVKEIPENASGKMAREQIVVTYYYRLKDTSVIVHHYEEGTTNKVSENVTITGRVEDSYTTEAATDIPSKYELCEDLLPENAEGEMTIDTIEVTYYYRVKDAVVNVKYLEKDTDEELADDERLDGKVDEEYSTEAKVIDNYTLVEHSGNESGKFEVEPLTVIYYYLQNTKATVQYIDEDTGEILEESTKSGLVGDKFETESKDFENYVLVREPEEKIVNMAKEEIVLKYYYSKVSGGVIEKHIDVNSGAILANEVHEGDIGDEYSIAARAFEGYDVVEDRLPVNSEGRMTREPIEVIYYYNYRATVTARYIDRLADEPIVADENQEGYETDPYTTERKTFDGYVLIEVPENADGEMTKEPIVVTYYYKKISGGVIVNHRDIHTNKQLADEEKIEGYEGEPYETSKKEFVGYVLVEDKYPENATGELTVEEQEVTYYYEAPVKVVVNYYDIDTNRTLTDEITMEGYAGTEYITEEKSFDYYVLTEVSGKEKGTMELKVTELDDGTKQVENIIYVNYSYRRMTFNLKIDKLVASVIIDGSEKTVNSDLGKVEVNRKELSTAKVQVVYTIKVTNDGELAGKATIEENIPEGMKMSAANNREWTIGETQATLETGEIKPGETKEYKVVLDWKNGESNVGSIVNTADIISTTSDAKFAETNTNDNKSGATVIVAIGTGDSTYMVIAGAVMLVLIAAGVVIYKKYRR